MNDTMVGTLTPRDIEENSAKCHICAGTLSYPEIINFGNRCLFCAEIKRDVSILHFLQHAYYDILIYKQILKWMDLKEKCPDCYNGKITQVVQEGRGWEEKDTVDTFPCPSCNGKGEMNLGRTKFLGHLGFVGCERYDQLSLKQKKMLLKSLKESK